MVRKTLDEKIMNERYAFVRGLGIDESVLDEPALGEKLYSVEVMRSSFEFFNGLELDIKRMYTICPTLLGCSREKLEPKLKFLQDELKLPKKRFSQMPEIFTYCLESMERTFAHYIEKFDGDKEKAIAMFRDATTVIGLNNDAVDKKMRKYEEAGIDFHKNYILLEIRPEKAIETKEYLANVGIYGEQTEHWYYMLLAISKAMLAPKVEYCEKEGIDWELNPRVLLLGLGTDEKIGALPRRVNMIKKSFKEGKIPSRMDYRINPTLLTYGEKYFCERLARYK